MTAPSTYQEWLTCFDIIKNEANPDGELFEALCAGSFSGSEITAAALQRQIVAAVNGLLDKGVKRFTRRLNECLAFNEISGADMLFKRLKSDVRRAMFFTRLEFLPESFKSELEDSVKTEMSGFWEDTLRFLREQSLEAGDPGLEDALFAIKRISLF